MLQVLEARKGVSPATAMQTQEALKKAAPQETQRRRRRRRIRRINARIALGS